MINARSWSQNVDIKVNLNYKVLITLAVNEYIYKLGLPYFYITSLSTFLISKQKTNHLYSTYLSN